MGEFLQEWWLGLSAFWQDIMFLLLLTTPAIIVLLVVTRGYRPWPLVRALLIRTKFTSGLFVLLIALSVALGVGILAQERALVRGSAQAADKFDLIITAPGSEMTMMLASVYLQPADMPLLSGKIYNEIASDKRVKLAAPMAFGDSYKGSPVVGTISGFVDHLSDGKIEGRMFAKTFEAVAGAKAAAHIGDEFVPSHGIGESAHEGVHDDEHFTVVGKMPQTGTPWDKAILVPVEAVWKAHDFANGHTAENSDQLGPPFDAETFPGTPAILVRAEKLWANYALRSEFTRSDTMAFFPGSVLANLHRLLGDVRQVMSVLSTVTQVLVAAGVLIGLVILIQLFAKQLALLRAIGAPQRFVFAIVWCFAAVLILAGSLLGLLGGYGAAMGLSAIVTQRTDIVVHAVIGFPEFHLTAIFTSLALLVALLPAVFAIRHPVLESLRR